jgi:hypothetical protein
MRLADANRRKAPILNGVLMISGDAAAVFMISLGLGAASTLVQQRAVRDVSARVGRTE